VAQQLVTWLAEGGFAAVEQRFEHSHTRLPIRPFVASDFAAVEQRFEHGVRKQLCSARSYGGRGGERY
jgi:hypothetical protein